MEHFVLSSIPCISLAYAHYSVWNAERLCCAAIVWTGTKNANTTLFFSIFLINKRIQATDRILQFCVKRKLCNFSRWFGTYETHKISLHRVLLCVGIIAWCALCSQSFSVKIVGWMENLGNFTIICEVTTATTTPPHAWWKQAINDYISFSSFPLNAHTCLLNICMRRKHRDSSCGF